MNQQQNGIRVSVDSLRKKIKHFFNAVELYNIQLQDCSNSNADALDLLQSYVLQSQWKQNYGHDAECSTVSIYYVNSLAPGKFELNFRHVIF